MIRLIVEFDGGVLCGIYSDAHQEQDFDVEILDRNLEQEDVKALDENKRLDALLRGPNWRGIY
jgi:hypothetical protein